MSPTANTPTSESSTQAPADRGLAPSESWSQASGPAAHVKSSYQDESHAPRRKALDLNFPSWCLGDVCAADVKEYLRHSDTILIPKASLEQHGAHLPLFCDSITSDQVARRAGRKAGILYTPTLWTGYSPQHLKAPGEGTGTITLRVETYLNLIYDIGRSLIHHGFRRLIFVNGHGSNIKVVDPVLRKLRNETGALIAYYKPYAERYLGMIADVLEGPVEETPGWHAGELETSQCLCHNPSLVRMDRAIDSRAHAPGWLGKAWKKKDGMPDIEFQDYRYFDMPFEHGEFTETGVMGNPHRAAAYKGEIAFNRFANHLIDAVHELEQVELTMRNIDWTAGKTMGGNGMTTIGNAKYPSVAQRSEFDSRALAAEVAEVIGRERVLEGREARRQHPGDMSWLTYIHAEHGRPLSCQDVVATPRTTQDVVAILKLAARLGVPVTTAGGASGVQGAANANCGGILLNMRDMKQVRNLDRKSFTCTVEPGMIVSSFEEQLNAQGLSFTHYPASAEWATVGGCVAARGSGVLSTKYGTIQDHVLSLEVVLPDGDIVQLPAVPRHGVGPELTQLFVGSEGTLGVITAVTVKIRSLPASRRFCVFRFDGLSGGIEAGRRIMTTGLRPAAMRLYDHKAATESLERAVQAGLDSETMVIMIDGDHEVVVDAELAGCRKLCTEQGGRELDAAIGRTWWDKRYVFYHPPHAPTLPQMWCTMDVTADFTHIEAVYDRVTRAMHEAVDPAWGLTLKTHLSHWYEWGSMIYPRFGIAKGPDGLDEALELHDRIVEAATLAAIDAGAVINDHHGVGMRLAPYLERQFGATGMDLLKKVKRAIDPDNVLCPGKLALA